MSWSKITITFLLTLFLSFPLLAKSQQIILTSHLRSGSFEFATELVRLWKLSKYGNSYDFSIKPVPYKMDRLSQLENGQGSMAIIDAQTALKSLEKFNGLRVLTVLWPNRIQFLGEVPEGRLTLDSTQNLLLHENTLFFAQVWKQLVPHSQIRWFNEDNVPDILTILSQPYGIKPNIMAISGPAPIQQIDQWLQQNPKLRLLSLEPQLIRALKGKYPWLFSQKLAANTYWQQTEDLDNVVWFPVLVVRRDVPNSLIKKILQMVFAEKKKLSPHVLFQELSTSNNLPFQKFYRFHPVAKKMYRFK